MVHKEKIFGMIENKEFVEYPLCPYCGHLTHLDGEHTPCCGKEIDWNQFEGKLEWVRLVPIDILEK